MSLRDNGADPGSQCARPSEAAGIVKDNRVAARATGRRLVLCGGGKGIGLEMRQRMKLLACTAAALALTQPLAIHADTREAVWKGQWISDTVASPIAPGVYHFRKAFDLTKRPSHFPVKVSADNRYRLFVNGVEVSNGPARGDLMHWRYDSRPGTLPKGGANVVAALVWNMGDFRPAAQVSLRTAFVMQGAAAQSAVVDTDKGWKVLSDGAYSFALVEGDDTGGFYVAGPRETIDARRYPWGWEQTGFDDTAWPEAGPIAQQFTSPGALPRGSLRQFRPQNGNLYQDRSRFPK